MDKSQPERSDQHGAMGSFSASSFLSYPVGGTDTRVGCKFTFSTKFETVILIQTLVITENSGDFNTCTGSACVWFGFE